MRFGEDNSGGLIDAAIPKAVLPYTDLPFELQARLTADQTEATRRIPWSGDLVLVSFRNTVNHGPLCYVPQVVGI